MPGEMTADKIKQYFDATENRATREDLIFAVEFACTPKIAIDCGCGAGSDIAFLRANGFMVYAFDIEQDAIARCQKRFIGDADVILSRSTFNTFKYPDASLISADASLFFCPENEFECVWTKIEKALLPGGVFVGSFLGPEDTMVVANDNREALWPNVLVSNENKIKLLLQNFEILSFKEHKTSGQTPTGAKHHWHIFAVVARKIVRQIA